EDVTLTGPGGGSIPVLSVTPRPDRPTTNFFVTFAPQGVAGTYNFKIGPNINDANGNPLDQNQNLLTGEVPGDQFISTFTIAPFSVSSGVAAGIPAGPVSSVRVTFNRPPNLSTFDTTDVSLTGPGGSIATNSITPVGTAGTQFDVN